MQRRSTVMYYAYMSYYSKMNYEAFIYEAQVWNHCVIQFKNVTWNDVYLLLSKYFIVIFCCENNIYIACIAA